MKYRFYLAAAAACFCLSGAAMAEEEKPHLGEQMYDFTIDTTTGGKFNLTEALEDHDMVLINLWATWCGPCRMEFPYMEEAWEERQDEVAIIAASVEPEDTMEALSAFAEENGMKFSVGKDTAGLDEYFQVVGIPTSVVVDRFGTICWMESGAITSKETFLSLFDTFTGDDYTESVIMSELPAEMPDVAPADEEALVEALNAEGGEIIFANDADEYVWPMLPEEVDGRLTVKASNAGHVDTFSTVSATVTTKEGDVLAFDYKASTSPVFDAFVVYVDGEKEKCFSGERDWSTYAIALGEGEHTILFESYVGDEEDTEENGIWLDEVRILAGEEGEAALEALPVYPQQGEAYLKVLNENAEEVFFDADSESFLQEALGVNRFFILNELTAEVEIGITEDMDPEEAFIYCDANGVPEQIFTLLTEEGTYVYSAVIDSIANTDYSYTDFYIYPSFDEWEAAGIMVYADEENLEDFVRMVKEEEDIELTWSYADDAPEAESAEEEGETEEIASELTYNVYVVDDAGNPVEGVIVNFCTDEQCVPMTTDAEGHIAYTGAPYAYHLQMLKAPEGYTVDKTAEYYTDTEGSDVTLTVTADN